MIKYPKIATLFKRDTEGTHKLMDGVYRSEMFEYLKDNQWEFTEKIDGTNIGVVWDGHQVSFQGRTERAQIPADLLQVLDEMFGMTVSEELFEQVFGEKNVILFGEGYGGKIQHGKTYREDPSFILFDVYFPEQDLYLRRTDMEDVAKTFGIQVVPIVLDGTLDDAVAFVKSRPASTIGTAQMEGVVGKPKTECRDRAGNRVIVKIKHIDLEV